MEFFKTQGKLLIVIFSVLVTLLMSMASVYAWFSGVGYSGSTMSYSRRIHIGATSSEITNFYGFLDSGGQFNYYEIDPELGFQYNNLVPGSYIYLRTDVENINQESAINMGLFLQDVELSAALVGYIYVGVSHPVSKQYHYIDVSEYNSNTDAYNMKSLSLIERQLVPEGETLSVFWYIYIDSIAGLEIANSNIDLGSLTVSYN